VKKALAKEGGDHVRGLKNTLFTFFILEYNKRQGRVALLDILFHYVQSVLKSKNYLDISG
jgi:hypothetical protein